MKIKQAVLSLRSRDRPEDTVRNAGEIIRPIEWPESGCVMILIHGFNVRPAAAESAFESFIASIDAGSSAAITNAVQLICKLHWPGDHEDYFMSKASFPARIPVARECGKLLADFLADNAGPRIVLVAHSLGSVLALETLLALRGVTRVRVSHAILMAAAVPTNYCGPPPDRYEVGSLSEGTRQVVLYSTQDVVLSSVFVAGWGIFQAGALDAVGLYGGPPGRWESPPIRTPFEHGGYWSSQLAPERVLDTMGLTLERFAERQHPDERRAFPWFPMVR